MIIKTKTIYQKHYTRREAHKTYAQAQGDKLAWELAQEKKSETKKQGLSKEERAALQFKRLRKAEILFEQEQKREREEYLALLAEIRY